ncbi:MAG: multidrug ABC transporter substrate-binding protein [Bacteroidetes bacterium CG12_big_fil_rev_8_21_14_0_65_60_17]|nr:MAG: multidrug ABC transporter substrate-binding protein [Bacteroidetes bacterium CG12_big_fil_rev_8_21_14_0_65_60_17]
MRPFRLVKVAGKSILKNKMRTLLTMLGIIIGVGAVLVMVAVGDGAKSQIENQIRNLGSNMLVVTPGSSSAGGVSRGSGSFNRLSLEDAEKIRNESVFVSMVSPVVTTFSQIIGGSGNWRARLNGVDVDYLLIRDWDLASGSWFTPQDVRSGKKVAVLGTTVADKLFSGQDPVGQTIQIRNVPVQVIGVLEPKGQTPEGSDQDDVVLAPYTTVQQRLSRFRFISQILVSTSNQNDIPAAQEEINQILRESHGLAQFEENDFEVKNQTQLADAASGTTEVMTLLLAAIASISLLVGGIGIMNIMLVSVTERTREIGIRMAIGARGSDVLVQFLIEAIVMSVLGGAIGVAVGFGGAALVANITGWSTVVEPNTVIVALVFSAAVGIFFGFYPARKAAAMNPIDALRFE